MSSAKGDGFAVYNNSFKFDYPRCDIKKNLYTDKRGNPIRDMSVRNTVDENISFHFKNALFRTDDFSDGENILLEFISISFDDEDKLVDFFSKNGFLFNTSTEEYRNYSYTPFFYIAKRLQLIVVLISEIQKKEPSHMALLKNILYFLLTNPVTLTVDDSPLYASYDHRLADHLRNIGTLGQYPAEMRNFPEDYKDFSPDTNILYFNYNEYASYYDWEVAEDFGRGYPEGLRNECILLHLIKNSVDHVNIKEGVQFYEDSLDKLTAMCSENKELIESIAKKVIKNEINHHVKRIVPSYNMDELRGSWSFPDLLSAIYYSLFFLNPEFELIKKCENPTCSNYYTILNSNKRKKYCSSRCANAVNQRKYRAKQIKE